MRLQIEPKSFQVEGTHPIITQWKDSTALDPLSAGREPFRPVQGMNIRKLLEEHARFDPDKPVLEIGAGAGELTRLISAGGVSETFRTFQTDRNIELLAVNPFIDAPIKERVLDAYDVSKSKFASGFSQAISFGVYDVLTDLKSAAFELANSGINTFVHAIDILPSSDAIFHRYTQDSSVVLFPLFEQTSHMVACTGWTAIARDDYEWLLQDGLKIDAQARILKIFQNNPSANLAMFMSNRPDLVKDISDWICKAPIYRENLRFRETFARDLSTALVNEGFQVETMTLTSELQLPADSFPSFKGFDVVHREGGIDIPRKQALVRKSLSPNDILVAADMDIIIARR